MPEYLFTKSQTITLPEMHSPVEHMLARFLLEQRRWRISRVGPEDAGESDVNEFAVVDVENSAVSIFTGTDEQCVEHIARLSLLAAIQVIFESPEELLACRKRKKRIKRLERLCSEIHQIVGYMIPFEIFPEVMFTALARAAKGKSFNNKTLLPYAPPMWAERALHHAYMKREWKKQKKKGQR